MTPSTIPNKAFRKNSYHQTNLKGIKATIRMRPGAVFCIKSASIRTSPFHMLISNNCWLIIGTKSWTNNRLRFCRLMFLEVRQNSKSANLGQQVLKEQKVNYRGKDHSQFWKTSMSKKLRTRKCRRFLTLS